jgi:hypothetical protein
MKLELKKFDPSTIKSDSVVVLIGKRNTGKSYCMKDILSYHKDLPVGVVISPTETANNFFETLLDCNCLLPHSNANAGIIWFLSIYLLIIAYICEKELPVSNSFSIHFFA